MRHLVLGIVIGWAGSHASAANVRLLDGTTAAGDVTHWDESQIVIDASGATRAIPREQLLEVRWSQPSVDGHGAPATEMSAVLADGTTVPITGISAEGRAVMLQTPLADGPVRIARELVSRLALQSTNEAIDALWRQLEEQQLAGDALLITRRDGELFDYLVGVVGKITDESVGFTFDGQEIEVNRSRVVGIQFYQAEPRPLPEATCIVWLADGWRATARRVRLDDDGSLSIITPAGARLKAPLNSVTRADFSAGKLAYLSDLEPADVSWTPRIALPGSASLLADYGLPRRDESFSGAPLALIWPTDSPYSAGDRRVYSKGMALRSRSDLTYRLPPGMSRFVATAGIDPATANQGHVLLEIRADDRILWEGEIDGRSSPEEIDVDLGSARRLQLRVDYGRNLDYGDRLHLVEARVTK